MAEEKREWLPASEWNDAVEKITAAQTQADHMDCDSRPREEQREPVEATDLNAYPKGMVESVAAYFSQERFQTWLKRATKPLHYPPDRRQVKKEFTEHFEERVEGLKDRGMPLSEARNKAVEMLGSPEETGELLRQVHKPWLGWVLRFFRLALIALVIVVAVKLIDGTDTLRFLTKNQVLQEFNLADETKEDGTEFRLTTIAERSWSSSDETRFGAFTVSCEDMIFRYQKMEWISVDVAAPIRAYDVEADVLLRFTGAPWDKMPLDIGEYIHIVDDNGVVYDTSSYNYFINNSQSIGVTSNRVLPWAYVISINFNNGGWKVENAKRLDIFLGKGESTQKLSVWLGDWELRDVDALPGEDEVDTSQWDTDLESKCVRWEELCAFAPAAEQKNGAELSISRALLELNNNNVECILAIRGDMALQPLSRTMLEQRLRIVDPAQGPDAPAIPCSIFKKEICRNVSFWEVCWETTPGVEAYELQYWPTQEGPAGTLTVELKEERES